MLDAMNQITPKAATRQRRGERSSTGTPLPCLLVHESYEAIIIKTLFQYLWHLTAILLRCPANLSRLSPWFFHTMRDIRSVLSISGKSKLAEHMPPFFLDTFPSPVEPTQQAHSYLSADPHFDCRTARTNLLSPILHVTFAASWLYAATRTGMSIPQLNLGTQVERVSCGTRTSQCIGNTAGLLIRNTNSKAGKGGIGGTGDSGKRGYWVFFAALVLHCFLKFSQPHSQTQTG